MSVWRLKHRIHIWFNEISEAGDLWRAIKLRMKSVNMKSNVLAALMSTMVHYHTERDGVCPCVCVYVLQKVDRVY